MRVSNQYFDQETGYHYNGQRYYDPLTARYLRNDPIGLEGGHNTYNFALKNPLKYVDLDGRYAETPLEAISIAIGLTSLVYNASNGNVVDSLIDVGGLVVDAIGVVIPVAPGVSSAAIASYRASKSLDTVVAKSAEGIVDATKGALRLPQSVGASVNITTRSLIKDSPFATRLAQKLSQGAQRDVDSLLSALRAGNANPGIGTRALGNGFFELRGRNAGRVIIKQTSSGAFDIIGKFQGHARGDAANSAIIQRFISGG
jgi:RHS repeat-associated protein